MAFAPLDPVLHNQLRLAIVSLLVSVDSADFNFLLEKTGAVSYTHLTLPTSDLV